MRETEKFPTLSMCEKRSTYFFLPSHRVKLDKSFINYVVARSLYMMVMMVRVLFSIFLVMIFLILNYHQKTIQRPGIVVDESCLISLRRAHCNEWDYESN